MFEEALVRVAVAEGFFPPLSLGKKWNFLLHCVLHHPQ